MDKRLLETIGMQHACQNQFHSEEVTLRGGSQSALLWVDSVTGYGVLDPAHWVPQGHYSGNYRSEASAHFSGKKYTPKEHLELYRRLDQQQFERISNLLTKGSKVLEIGCSYGGVLRKVEEYGVEICHGVEPNAEDVHFLEKTLPRASVKQGGFLELDLLEDYYDVVVSFQVLEHVIAPRLFLDKIIRVLKKGGAVHLEVPNHNAALLRHYAHAEHSDFYYHRNHIHYFTPESLSQLCKTIGFEGLVSSELAYPFFNHVYWHFNQAPQANAKIAINTPRPCDDSVSTGRAINDFFQDVEKQYSRLIQSHEVGDILVYQGYRN
jgi:2-polyprenyl-3-methyl-5-hydroxy-6-metoxy-1,4-benzoquinol methylase